MGNGPLSITMPPPGGELGQIDCFPTYPCRCCECQGRCCLVWHPGHSHRDVSRSIADWCAMDALRPMKEKPKRPDGHLGADRE